MKIEISGTDHTDKLESGSLSIDKKYSDNSISRFTLVTDGSYEPLIGEPVDIYDEESRHIFGGEVDSTRQVTRNSSGDKIFYEVDLVGWEDLTTRRVINKDYTDELAGDIIRDIHAEKLADENITLGKVNDGIAINGTLRFSYQKINQAFDKVTEYSGLRWRIKPDKTLEAIALDDFSNVRTLTDDTRDINVNKNRDEYRNRQIVIGGEPDFDNIESENLPKITETVSYQLENGINYIVLSHAIDELVDIDPGTVGLVTTSYYRLTGPEINTEIPLRKEREWSYEPGDKKLSHNPEVEPLDDGQDVTVTYRARTNTTAISDDPGKQTTAQETEQGTGIHTDVMRADGILDEQQCKQFAQKMLDIYGEYETEITFSDTQLYQVGDRLDINITDFNVDDQYVTVERVEIEDERKVDGNLLRNITATTMPDPGGWEDFFRNTMISEDQDDESGSVQFAPDSSGVGSIGTSQSWEDGKYDSSTSQGRYIFITDGSEVYRYNLAGKQIDDLGNALFTPTACAVGNGSLFVWDGRFYKINTVKAFTEGFNVDYYEEFSSILINVDSPNTFGYSDILSAKTGNDVLWIYEGGYNAKAIDIKAEKTVTTIDISPSNGYPDAYEKDEDSPRGLDEANGKLYFPAHDNFDFSWNIFAADFSGRFQQRIGIGRDEELSGGFAATGDSFYIRENVPDNVYYCDSNGKFKRSIAGIDAKDIGVGAI